MNNAPATFQNGDGSIEPTAENAPYHVVAGVCGVLVNLASGTVPGFAIAGAGAAVILNLLWPPKKEDPWMGIKDKVEALVRKKIEENHLGTIKNDLAGLKKVVATYCDTVKDAKDPDSKLKEAIRGYWRDAMSHITKDRPHFQDTRYALPLLPLLVEFANLHIVLLRDIVLYGAKFDFPPTEISNRKKELSDVIGDGGGDRNYRTWVKKYYEEERPSWSGGTSRQYAQYEREMTALGVDEAYDIWEYLDLNKYGKKTLKRRRLVWFGPYGSTLKMNDQKDTFSTRVPSDSAKVEHLEKITLKWNDKTGLRGVDNTISGLSQDESFGKSGTKTASMSSQLDKATIRYNANFFGGGFVSSLTLSGGGNSVTGGEHSTQAYKEQIELEDYRISRVHLTWDGSSANEAATCWIAFTPKNLDVKQLLALGTPLGEMTTG